MGNTNAKSVLNDGEFTTILKGTDATFSNKISAKDMSISGTTDFNEITGKKATFTGEGKFGSSDVTGEGKFGSSYVTGEGRFGSVTAATGSFGTGNIGVGSFDNTSARFDGPISGTSNASFAGLGSFGQSVTLNKGTANWQFNIKDDNSLCISNDGGQNNLVCIGSDGRLV